ncbi:MAG: hypothetical protein VYD53_04810 [Pseudomonadota bacterium]|uniref:Uncharacterized protein n=1 Tax=Alteromonas oceani TaxID=2071609 RepID=A0ABV7JTJ2_9ALTE|nr:hypothetical protein [Alteromonas oceani]MEC9260645.1 hypothetical protein [Pseudomonadota bacterium]
MLVDLLVLTSCCLLFRFVPAWLKLPGFDSDAHFYFYQQLKTTQQSAFRGVDTNIVYSRKSNIPLLWHWLVARIPVSVSYAFCSYLNALIELLFCIVVYLTLSFVLPSAAAILVVLLYLTTPLWFSTLAIGPRIVGFTPRLSCEILLSVFFLLVSVGGSMPVYLILPVLVVLAYLVILSFKFGIQAIVFISLFYSVLSFDWLPLIAIVIAGGLALVFSKGYFAEAFSAQVKHLVWYFKMVRRGEGDIVKRNSMRAFPAYTAGQERHFLVGAIKSLLISNSYTIVLLKAPALVMLTGFYVAVWFTNEASLISVNAFWLVISASLVFVLTSTRLFIFLGEAERYLNCIALVICVDLVRYCSLYEMQGLLLGVMAYGLLFFFLEYIVYPWLAREPVKATEDNDDLLVLNWLKDNVRQFTLLLYPYHAATGLWRILGQTKHKLVFCFNLDREFSKRFESQYGATYPFTNLQKIDDMADDFGLNCVVIDKSKLPGNVDFSPRWQRVDDIPCKKYLILVEQGI